MTSQTTIALTNKDFQEIFALFSSPTDDERIQVYDEASDFYFRKQDLSGEYSLTEEKKDFSVDAWRAVIYFLDRHGYTLVKEGVEYDLGRSSGYSGPGHSATPG